MNLSKIAINRPIGVLVWTIAIIVLGGYFFSSLSVDLLPRITYPLVRIIIDWKGASPNEIEENILKKVDANVATTEDAIQVLSSAIEGTATIQVFFEYGKNMDVALADTMAKIDLIRNSLPPDVEEPKVYKADPSQLPILEIGFNSIEKSERDLRNWVENELSNYYLGIPGLAAVVALGGKVREIQIVFDQNKVQQYELSTEKILNLIRLENTEYPVGRIENISGEYTVRLLSKFESITEIENLIVANRELREIRIKDIAKVLDANEEQRVITQVDGVPSVVLSFLKQPNANTVSVVDEIIKQTNDLTKKGIISKEISNKVISNQAYYVGNAISNVKTSAVFGGLLAAIIIWFFLYSIKRTVVILIAIPVSFIGTFILMGLFGTTLNIFSLAGLLLAIGIVVDSSVVMLENITRHQQNKNLTAKDAATLASAEVTSPLFAATFANLSIIVPFFLISGISSLLFRDLVITLASALLFALLVSLTVIPSLSASFKSNSDTTENWNTIFINKITHFYKKILIITLRFRFSVILFVLVLFVLSLFLLNTLGKEFLPQIDDGKITIKASLDIGMPLEQTKNVVKQVEDAVNKNSGIKQIYSMIGGYWAGRNVYQKSNFADIQVELVEKSKRPLSTDELVKKLRKYFKKNPIEKTNLKIMKTRLRGIRKTSTSDIDIRVKGKEFNRLFSIAEDIRSKIDGTLGLHNLDISVDFSKPEIHVKPKREKLNDFGLTANDLFKVLRTSVDGTIGTEFTDKEQDLNFDIRVMANPSSITNKEQLEQILLYPPAGRTLKLKEVADVIYSTGPVQIDRDNQVRLISVTADAIGRNVGKVVQDVKQKLDKINLPEGYYIEFGGDEEAAKDSNLQLLIVIALSIFLLFVIMATQYDSLKDPVLIMITLPLALMGAIFLLAALSIPFSIVVFLGIILLVGIVVNNAIVLVEYINQLKLKSGPLQSVIIEAAATRVRPILMTSLTTIIGLFPLIIGQGEGLEMLIPLGITIVGGLGLATFLTLFVIPIMYTFFYKMEKM